MRTQTTKTIAGRVNADGTAGGGVGFTSRKTATGNYAIVLPATFRLIGGSGAATSGSACAACQVSAVDSRTLGLQGLSPTGTIVDGPLSFVAVGAG